MIRKVINASLILACLTLFAKALGFGKELLIAYRFGVSEELDAYLAALLIPTITIQILFQSFGVSLVPVYVRVREQEGEQAANLLFSRAMFWAGVLLLAAVALLAVSGPLLFRWMYPAFSPQAFALTKKLFWVLLLFLLLGGACSVWNAILEACKAFTATGAAQWISPATVAASLLLLGRQWGVFALAAGVAAGALLEAAALGWRLRKQNLSLLPRYGPLDPRLRAIFAQYGPLVLAMALFSSSSLIDQAMASPLGAGSISTLNYGSRLVGFAVTILSIPFSKVAFPYFTKIAADGDLPLLRRFFRNCVFSALLLTVPFTAGMMIMSSTIIEWTFQQGAFSEEAGRQVALCQTMYAFQIPLHILGVLLVRIASALLKNQLMLIAGAAGAVANIVLNGVLRESMGVAGIALSTSLVYGLNCSVMMVGLWKTLRRSDLREGGGNGRAL